MDSYKNVRWIIPFRKFSIGHFILCVVYEQNVYVVLELCKKSLSFNNGKASIT